MVRDSAAETRSRGRAVTRLAALDELTIPDPRTGRPIQRLGVTAQFSIPDGHRPEARRAALDVLLETYSLAPSEFQRWMVTDDHRPRAIRETFAADAVAAVGPLIDRHDRLSSLAILPRDDPPRRQSVASMLPEDSRRSWLSTLSVSMPPSAALRAPDDHVRKVLAWAATLRPQYGTAGFALADELGMAQHRGGVGWSWLERHPGLDCDTFNLQPKPGRYVTANWLTVLGDEVLRTLGGLEVVQRRVRDAAAEHEVASPDVLVYAGGALIRSGPAPELGDRAAGDVPAAYRAVNRALRPARFEDYPQGPNIHLIDAPRTLDLRQATLDWVGRFDGAARIGRSGDRHRRGGV